MDLSFDVNGCAAQGRTNPCRYYPVLEPRRPNSPAGLARFELMVALIVMARRVSGYSLVPHLEPRR